MQTTNAVAFVLLVLGLGGMVRHFLTKDATTPSTTPAAIQSSEYRVPARPGPMPDTGDAEKTAAIRDMRRRLREFVIPFTDVREHSLTDALALLQNHWETLPHETDAVPPATFTASQAALDLPSAQSPVFLQIPGISLLTNLELLAAQIDLHLRITESGTILEPHAAAASSTESTATIALNNEVLQKAILRSNGVYTRHFSGPRDPGLPYDASLNPFRHPSGVEVSVRLFKAEKGDLPEADSDLPQDYPDAFPVIDPRNESFSEVTATASDDGYTIDLDLDPEVIEFEGFINYGAPINTSGVDALPEDYPVDFGSPTPTDFLNVLNEINAIGQKEPIVLTDSRITEPVFPTRVLANHQRTTLAKLFTSLGIEDNSPDGTLEPDGANPIASISGSLPGVEWSPETGTLSATGPPRTLRTAAALAAALHEAATAGAKLEFAAIQWTGDHPPAEPTPLERSASKTKAKSTNPDLPQASMPTPTSFRLRCGIRESGNLPRLDFSTYPLLPEPSFSTSTVAALTEASGALFPTDLTLTLPGRPDFLTPATAASNRSNQESLSFPARSTFSEK